MAAACEVMADDVGEPWEAAASVQRAGQGAVVPASADAAAVPFVDAGVAAGVAVASASEEQPLSL